MSPNFIADLPHLPSWLIHDDFALSRWVFLRGLAIVYLIAFSSLWVQIHGLIGERGILPLADLVSGLRKLDPKFRRFQAFPMLFWISHSDAAIHAVCAGGVICSILLLFNIAPMLSLAVLWIAYLSLMVAGQEFMSFQWDALLLETGFLAIFFAPLGWLPAIGSGSAVPGIVLLLFWWLLFRLMFESGIVKLSFGDSLWRNCSALEYHYVSQPLPTPFAWYFHHAPRWFHRISCAFLYLVEIALPFLIFAPQELHFVACAGFVLLMFLIFLTGNYNFFNLLTVVLSFLLLDDSFWRHVLPQTIAQHPAQPVAIHGWEFALAALIALVSIRQLIQAIAPSVTVSKFWRLIQHGLQPFMIINSYGLFRAMTTRRREIVIEGSDNGVEWKEFEFRYKAGNVGRRPPFVQPHAPRLDWQMWFAALSFYQMTPWFEAFLIRIMENSPEVVGPLKKAPIEGPHFIRAMLYEYRFTTPAEKRRTGTWWHRELIGAYSPILIRRTPKEALAATLDSPHSPSHEPS